MYFTTRVLFLNIFNKQSSSFSNVGRVDWNLYWFVCLCWKEREKQNTSRLIRELLIIPLSKSPKPLNKIQKTNLKT